MSESFQAQIVRMLGQVHDGNHLGDGGRWDGDHYDLECQNQQDEY